MKEYEITLTTLLTETVKANSREEAIQEAIEIVENYTGRDFDWSADEIIEKEK